MTRVRGAMHTIVRTAAEEYEAYARAGTETEAGRLSFGQRHAPEAAGGLHCWWRGARW